VVRAAARPAAVSRHAETAARFALPATPDRAGPTLIRLSESLGSAGRTVRVAAARAARRSTKPAIPPVTALAPARWSAALSL
jgi:hypothetical protein